MDDQKKETEVTEENLSEVSGGKAPVKQDGTETLETQKGEKFCR